MVWTGSMLYNLAQLLKEPIGSTRDYEVADSFAGPENGTDRSNLNKEKCKCSAASADSPMGGFSKAAD